VRRRHAKHHESPRYTRTSTKPLELDLKSATPSGAGEADGAPPQAWDTASKPEFFQYYADESLSERTLLRYTGIRDAVLRVIRPGSKRLRVADIGCGAGTQAYLWAESGHAFHGLDVNQPLIELARQRAREAGVEASFEVGSATALPWDDESMDVCLLPELLEHVAEWETCLDEAARVLVVGGVLYLSTTNKLCPKQGEFELPMYSWYPAPLKRHFERLATTSHPQLVNHATYPAVNWFSFYGLRAFLEKRGFECMDRFDLAALGDHGALQQTALRAVRSIPPLRLLAHVATPYTAVLARKLRTI